MIRRRALLAAALLAFAGAAAAGEKRVFAPGGLAIGGYDTVAYFTQGRAVPGRPDLSVKWKGAIWRFATEANRLAFEMDPRRYAPQYGGYCAMAVAQGRLAEGSPEVFTIHDGRLYLSRSAEVRQRWRGDLSANVARADANWPGVTNR